MSEQNRTREQISLRMPPDLLDWAREHAAATYDTVTRLIILALAEYRDRQQAEQGDRQVAS